MSANLIVLFVSLERDHLRATKRLRWTCRSRTDIRKRPLHHTDCYSLIHGLLMVQIIRSATVEIFSQQIARAPAVSSFLAAAAPAAAKDAY